MIRAVIVDDEPNTEGIIRYFIVHGDLPIEIVGTANNGRTIVDYINRTRIDQARKLLESGVSVKDTAERVGYNSLNIFYKNFKRFTGWTPAEYIKKPADRDRISK